MLDNVKYIFNIFQIKEGREEVAASERGKCEISLRVRLTKLRTVCQGKRIM